MVISQYSRLSKKSLPGKISSSIFWIWLSMTKGSKFCSGGSSSFWSKTRIDNQDGWIRLRWMTVFLRVWFWDLPKKGWLWLNFWGKMRHQMVTIIYVLTYEFQLLQSLQALQGWKCNICHKQNFWDWFSSDFSSSCVLSKHLDFWTLFHRKHKLGRLIFYFSTSFNCSKVCKHFMAMPAD